jgi:glutathione synthase/RimK-type ligase-like ATP-grasp enzyme
MKKYKLAILKNEREDDHLDWLEACTNFAEKVDFKVIDLIREDWLENICAEDYDFFLTKAPGRIPYIKQLYDERIYIIHEVLNLPVYPTLNEILIYENKRFLSYYLKTKNIPHPATRVIYDKEEALTFAANCDLPVVAKTNIGAGGSGVKIIKSKNDLCNYIENSFSFKGVKRSFLPNMRKGDYLKRLKKRLGNIAESVEYFKDKHRAATIDPQKGFVILQEYIQTDFEWRCVVINDSYFGHKKLRSIGDKMSGTSKVSWDLPDEQLLNLLKNIMQENNFWSQAIDLFYNSEKGYLVNELQCFWGSKNPHQMLKDGRPGRFTFKNNRWIFEEGAFNGNNSYDLRLKHILYMLDKQKAL